jgi:cell division protein FtsL
VRTEHGHDHGWSRAADRASDTAVQEPVETTAPPAVGTVLLLFVIVGMLTAVGIAQVHMHTRVLELGAEITELTAEQAELRERRRRLETERAYLRHPDQVLEFARNRLRMVPMSPERIQRIELVPGDGSP